MTRTQRRAWLPPQHGAWGMLAVPFLLGVAASGPTWLHLPLLLAWYGAYLASYDLFQLLRVARPRPYVAPLLTYSAVTVLAAVPVLVSVPSVMVFGLVYLPLLAVNAAFAHRGKERALVNDLALVGEATLMAPVAYVVGVGGVGNADLGLALSAATISLLFLVGTVLHVKTMIRERGNPRYRRASIAWHAASLAVATLISPWFLVPFGFLLIRAAVLPGRKIQVRTVGLIELGGSVLLVVFGILAL